MQSFDRFLWGIIAGLLLPIGSMWLYLYRLYPAYQTLIDSIKDLYPSLLFGKILLLSVMPNLMLVFIFYKTDNFKIARGLIVGAMPYIIVSIFML